MTHDIGSSRGINIDIMVYKAALYTYTDNYIVWWSSINVLIVWNIGKWHISYRYVQNTI